MDGASKLDLQLPDRSTTWGSGEGDTFPCESEELLLDKFSVQSGDVCVSVKRVEQVRQDEEDEILSHNDERSSSEFF
ncbi:uncharacterized [Tachysurus ichikawai]